MTTPHGTEPCKASGYFEVIDGACVHCGHAPDLTRPPKRQRHLNGDWNGYVRPRCVNCDPCSEANAKAQRAYIKRGLADGSITEGPASLRNLMRLR